MKTPIFAIIIGAFAFTTTSTFASDLQQLDIAVADQVIEGLGLSIDSSRTPVGEIFDLSTTLA